MVQCVIESGYSGANSLPACAGGKCCPLTGLPLEGWVMLVSNEGLRREIKAWACSVGLDLDVLAEVAYRSSSAPSACSDLARSCAAVDTKVCAGKGTGARRQKHTRRSWYRPWALHVSAHVLVALVTSTARFGWWVAASCNAGHAFWNLPCQDLGLGREQRLVLSTQRPFEHFLSALRSLLDSLSPTVHRAHMLSV